MPSIHNSHTPSELLLKEHITAQLPWALLVHVLRGEAPVGELRPAIRAMSAEAHRRSLSAERFLIEVKQDLMTTAGLSLATCSVEQRDILGRLVSLCIDEYYRAD